MKSVHHGKHGELLTTEHTEDAEESKARHVWAAARRRVERTVIFTIVFMNFVIVVIVLVLTGQEELRETVSTSSVPPCPQWWSIFVS